MISSGIRVGSWDYLKWKHVIPIKKNNIIVAAKLIVRNTKIHNGIYYSFITPEAFHALNDWMEVRRLHGEYITGESWLMRDTWQTLTYYRIYSRPKNYRLRLNSRVSVTISILKRDSIL